MKMTKTLFIALGLSIMLAACSSEDEAKIEVPDEASEASAAEEESAESSAEEGAAGSEAASEEEATVDESTRYSETDQSDEYVVTKSAQMNDVVEMGDLKLSFLGSTTGWFTADEMDEAFLDGYAAGENVYIVAFDVELENTGETTETYYFDVNSEIVTDSKEQIKSEVSYSDSIPGELHGNTVHNATIAFVTKTPPEDIEEVTFMVPTYWGDDTSNPISEGEEVTAYYQ